MGPTYVPRRVLNKMIYETSGRDKSDQPEWYVLTYRNLTILTRVFLRRPRVVCPDDPINQNGIVRHNMACIKLGKSAACDTIRYDKTILRMTTLISVVLVSSRPSL